MGEPNPKVDGFIRKSDQWRQELVALRAILLDGPLTEEVKWRVPCYTFAGRNVAFLGRLKDACVLSFVKGVLLADADRVLVQPGENSQSVRVVRFTDVGQIAALAPVLKRYLAEAVELERAGRKVTLKRTADFKVVEEFRARLDEHPALRAAFAALTPGRQRAYLMHVAAAKQAKTRVARVEKCAGRILDGKGLDD